MFRLLRKRFCSSISKTIFQYKIDSYNGVILTENIKNMSLNEFESKLLSSMKIWKEEQRLGIWIRIPIEESSFIPIVVSHGFWFHHCGSEYILLCNWLPGGKTVSRLPPSPSHYIGVAGFILNSRNEILMVQERNGPAAGIGLWKLPGGLCDVGEDIHNAVIREVKEETGLDAEFLSLTAILEGHRGQGPTRENASDLYCVCVLKALDEYQPLKMQELELENCAWIPVNQALNHHPILSPDTAFGKIYRTALTTALNYQNSTEVTKKYIPSSPISLGLTQSKYPIRIGQKLSNVLHIKFSDEIIKKVN